jgi:hypothetical protein
MTFTVFDSRWDWDITGIGYGTVLWWLSRGISPSYRFKVEVPGDF